MTILFNGAFSQIDTNAIGRILTYDKQKPIGSAFVAGKSKSIYTCSHVVIKDTLWFQSIGSKMLCRIVPKYDLPCYDIAFLERTGGKQKSTLEFGNFKKTQPGDKIYYVGWDTRINKYVIWSAVVQAKGSAQGNGKCSLDFIDFPGKAIPGYSGGPVFNENGHVIAMIGEAWIVKGIRGGEETNMNRAYSIELLRVLDSEIRDGASKKLNLDKKMIDLIK